MISLINIPRSVDKNCKCAPIPYTEAQLKELFMRFDINKDGQLSKQELKNAFNSLGAKFPAWRAYRALHHADGNGDGYISENELGEVVKYANRCGYTVN